MDIFIFEKLNGFVRYGSNSYVLMLVTYALNKLSKHMCVSGIQLTTMFIVIGTKYF